MRRRPWPIVVLAFFQCFIEPVTNVFFNAWLNHMSPRVYLDMLFRVGFVSTFYVLVLPPLMGIAVFAMKRWSFPVFVAGATWTLFRNFVLFEQGASFIPLAVATYLGNVAFVAYFLLPAVRAPFMNQRLRWWETARRYYVDFAGRAENDAGSYPCRLKDLSSGGAFVLLAEKLENGEQCRLRFSPNAKEILSLKVKVVFARKFAENQYGYGVQFLQMTPAQKAAIGSLIRDLQASGCPMRESGPSAWEDFSEWISRLASTGQGWLPETDEERRARVAREAAEDKDRDVA